MSRNKKINFINIVSCIFHIINTKNNGKETIVILFKLIYLMVEKYDKIYDKDSYIELMVNVYNDYVEYSNFDIDFVSLITGLVEKLETDKNYKKITAEEKRKFKNEIDSIFNDIFSLTKYMKELINVINPRIEYNIDLNC